jgi:exonuclease SbcD
MLGNDLVLSGGLVRDTRLDYVALGHIHKAQDLNEGAQPPVVYPGSIERVDFGEVQDDKFFVIAKVGRGDTQVEWRQLEGIRRFIDRRITLAEEDSESPLTGTLVSDRLRAALPPREQLAEAVVRLVVEYPREMEALIDEAALREHVGEAFEFMLVKRPQMDARIRLPEDQAVGSLTHLELLDLYWRSGHIEAAEAEVLSKLAQEVISAARQGD